VHYLTFYTAPTLVDRALSQELIVVLIWGPQVSGITIVEQVAWMVAHLVKEDLVVSPSK
jgi:hypothetical protein